MGSRTSKCDLERGLIEERNSVSIYDSTEEAIKKMVEANERIMALGGVQRDALNTATKRLYELQVETLQNAPTDKVELERLLKVKQKQKEKATYIEDTERLMTEIEMLKIVLYLMNRNSNNKEQQI
jgi:hypothetical protein